MTDALDRLETALADRFTIERELGSGGMATVYLAEDVKHHRKVAVKVLRPELAAALGVDRFHREIEIAAQLTHPHVLTLIDSGEADGFVYYVMPFIEGESLRQKLAREGELPVSGAVRILRDVVDALGHAHKHGVVHRDIKPDNVLLSERHALVTDFGVAKAVSEATDAEHLTIEGIALGTPCYMSPEQATADPQTDHRSDIYAVGILAYELLTGRTPFVGRTSQTVLSAQLVANPEPIEKYRESVTPVLRELVMKCLEKRPADRWQSAEELLPQLEALATPSGGITPTGTMPVDRVAKRKWMVTGGVVGAAAVVALIVAIAAIPRGSGLMLDPDRVVVAVFENQTGNPSLDPLGVMAGHWITQGLQQSGVVRVVPWMEAQQASRYVAAETEAGDLRNPIDVLAEETGAGTVISGSYYRFGESIQFHAEVIDAVQGESLGALKPETAPHGSPEDAVGALQGRAMGMLAVAFDERLATRAGALARPPTFEAYRAFEQGVDRYIRSEFQEALPHFARAFELDTTFALALQYQAIDYYALRQYRQADSVLNIMAPLLGQLSDLDAAWVEYLDSELDGDHERALQAIRQAAEIAPRSKAAYNRALVAVNTNRPHEALDALRALDPERGPMRGWIGYWSILCTALHELGEHERELVAAYRMRELLPDRALTAEFHAALALAAVGRIDELDELLDNVILLPPVDGLSADEIMLWASNDLRGHGHHATSQHVVGRAIEWFEAQPTERAEIEVHRYNYGMALYLTGRWQEATRVFGALADAFPDNLNYLGYLGALAARRGDRDSAVHVANGLQSVDRPYMFGLHTWWRARIWSVLGESEQAVALLREARAQGRVDSWHVPAIDFDPLRDYPPFQELMRPKG